MLTHNGLVDLYRNNRDRRVLSVYLDADAHDPAERSAWRRVLDHLLDDARAAVNGESAADRKAFDAASQAVRAELGRFDAFLPDRGWVGFANGGDMLYAESLRVPMPSLARWGEGLLVAPYVRALKQSRPVVTVLADSRQARLYRYRDATLDQVAELEADTALGDLSDVNQAKRASTHSGVRGETSTDAAHRFLEVGTERMLKQLAERVPELAGNDGFVVVGGTPEMVAATAGRLGALGDRVTENTSLHLALSHAEVLAATERAATEMSARLGDAHLDTVLDAARSRGRGCLGREETEKALTERRVETLFLSRRFLLDRPALADHFVGLAFEQSADVEDLAGDAGERLDREAGGIAAMLRYRL